VNDPRHSTSVGDGPRADGPGTRPPRPRLSGRVRLIMLVLVILVNLALYAPFLRPTSTTRQISIPYSTFLAQVRVRNVKTARLSANTASGDFATPYTDATSGTRYPQYTTTLLPVPDPALVPLMTARGVQITAESQASAPWLTAVSLLIGVLPVLFLLGLFYVHGAATRVPATATAFSARRPLWDFDIIGQWSDPAESSGHIAWVKALWDRLEPELLGTVYINHMAADDRPEKVRASYGENYARLRELKAVYDPMNLFRVNANVSPV